MVFYYSHDYDPHAWPRCTAHSAQPSGVPERHAPCTSSASAHNTASRCACAPRRRGPAHSLVTVGSPRSTVGSARNIVLLATPARVLVTVCSPRTAHHGRVCSPRHGLLVMVLHTTVCSPRSVRHRTARMKLLLHFLLSALHLRVLRIGR